MSENNNCEKNEFKMCQFVMIRKMINTIEEGKKLTKKLTGPFLIIDIKGAVVTLICSKSHKEVKVNIGKVN